jgi:hypothetical protein
MASRQIERGESSLSFQVPMEGKMPGNSCLAALKFSLLCRVSRIRDFDIEPEAPYSLGATASIFLFWGLAASTPMLCIFSLMYGLFAGGFSASFPGVIKAVKTQSPDADAGIIFGLVPAGRGIGAVVSVPLSARMMGTGQWEAGIGRYGTGLAVLIIFTGITALFGSIS